jgi:RimJ/RimL family protein N-acetyltransferase
VWKLKSTSQRSKPAKKIPARVDREGVIKGRLARLCRLERRHLDRSRSWFNDPELARLLGRTRKISDAGHKEWFSGLHQREDCVYFAIEIGSEGQYVGNIWLWGVDTFHRKAELRILIGERDCLERGIGTEAIQLLCQYGFNNMKLHKIYAYVHATNPRARRAFEKAGFEVEGILKDDRCIEGRFTNVYLLGKLHDTH